MKKSAILVCGLMAAAALNVKAASGQQFPGTNSMLTSPTTLTLMRTLGYAPTDYCGFYFYLSTSYQGRFSADLLRALLPMCANWPRPEPPDDDGSGSTGETGGTGGTGSTGGTGGTGSTGGTGGTGSTGGTGGSGSTGETGGGTGEGGSTGGEDEDPFGGGSMATPEPISLILLGTGLAGIGGLRASRKRRHNPED